jgi:hypothetical protein
VSVLVSPKYMEKWNLQLFSGAAGFFVARMAKDDLSLLYYENRDKRPFLESVQDPAREEIILT